MNYKITEDTILWRKDNMRGRSCCRSIGNLTNGTSVHLVSLVAPGTVHLMNNRHTNSPADEQQKKYQTYGFGLSLEYLTGTTFMH